MMLNIYFGTDANAGLADVRFSILMEIPRFDKNSNDFKFYLRRFLDVFGIFLTDSRRILDVRVVFLTHSCKSYLILYTVDTNQAGSHDLSSSVLPIS